MYNLELVNWFLSSNNFLRIDAQDATGILNRGIDDVPLGQYTGEETSINSPILRHLATAGYHARVILEKENKFLEIWVPGLITFKLVDWSIFHHGGTTIPRHLHPQVDKLVGRHLARGDKEQVEVILHGKSYEAWFRNVDRDVTGDTYQLMYSGNEPLQREITDAFDDLPDRVKPYKPIHGPYYFELIATATPRVVQLNLHNGKFSLATGVPHEKYIKAFSVFESTLQL